MLDPLLHSHSRATRSPVSPRVSIGNRRRQVVRLLFRVPFRRP